MKNAAAYMRKRREEAAKAGLCSICTARKARAGLLTCEECGSAGVDGKKRWRKKARIRTLIGK